MGFSAGKLIGRRAFAEGNKEKGKLVYQDSQLPKNKATDLTCMGLQILEYKEMEQVFLETT